MSIGLFHSGLKVIDPCPNKFGIGIMSSCLGLLAVEYPRRPLPHQQRAAEPPLLVSAGTTTELQFPREEASPSLPASSAGHIFLLVDGRDTNPPLRNFFQPKPHGPLTIAPES
jgi:hypothetical protein